MFLMLLSFTRMTEQASGNERWTLRTCNADGRNLLRGYPHVRNNLCHATLKMLTYQITDIYSQAM